MLEKSCELFIEELSTKEPIPGGGGTSAYVGALGMALGSMVGNLTLGKKKYIDVEEDILKLQKQAEIIIEKLKELTEEDAKVFYPLSKAYGLPSDTSDEKAVKNAVLQEALLPATMVPLEIMKQCVDAIELHEEYAKKGSVIAISDVGVGVAFCKAALQGAKFNVLINTKIMKNKEQKEEIEKNAEILEQKGMIKADRILKSVEMRLKGQGA